MFTGIIEAVGNIGSVSPRDGDIRLEVNTNSLDMADVQLGDSIAVNGICLTVIKFDKGNFCADVSVETINCTTLSEFKAGTKVNLEKAMLPTSRLGGHIVSGHVDGIGVVQSREDDARSVKFEIKAPDELAKYIAMKGSITVDGTSLTVNNVRGSLFTLNIVPHTLDETIIAGYQSGVKVNLEVDIIARYLERLLLGDAATSDHSKSGSSINMELLAKNGFLK